MAEERLWLAVIYLTLALVHAMIVLQYLGGVMIESLHGKPK